jgi:ATP-binding cassette subfamily F protein uup
MFAPNVLLLDEPTNDLDIQTLTVLEDYLDTFKGAVIVVSHDRYFLDRSVQRLLAFNRDEPGQVREYPGGYSIYAEFRQREEEEATEQARKKEERRPAARPAQRAPEPEGPRRLSYRERRELSTLEGRIEKLEAQKASLSEQINQIGDDYQRYEALAAELAALDAELEAAVERWAELAELA